MRQDKWVWIIGAGALQIPIITRAVKEGYKVLVSDQNRKAPGIQFADQFIEISTKDFVRHQDIALSMNKDIVGVLTAGADVGHTVAVVAETLGLPSISRLVARTAEDKSLMRKALESVNPHPKYCEISFSDIDPRQTWQLYCRKNNIDPYPCVIKPINNSASRGVTLVTNKFGIFTAVREARKYTHRPKSHCIIEQYLEGPEVSLDFLIVKSRMKLVNSSWRIFSKFGIERGFINPWDPPKNVLSLCRNVRKALDVTWGPLKIDLKCTKEHGWVVMETATRLSGGFDHSHAATLNGKDITGALLQLSTTGDYNRKLVNGENDSYVAVLSPEIEPGPITGVFFNGWDNVHVFHVAKEAREIKDCSDRAIWFACHGSTPFDAYRNVRSAENSMVIQR